MKKIIVEISLLIILACGYYCLFTLPNITKIIFNIGFGYTLWINIFLGIISGILANITLYKLRK